jgi:uroporphyrinogen-III synthase
MGYQPVVAPLLAIRTLNPPLPPAERVQAILVTSASAIPPLPQYLRHLPLYAVGDATAARAQAAGFAQVASADGDATALAALVAESCAARSGPLLFACGQGQGAAFVADLRARGFAVIRRAVYRIAPARVLPNDARTAFGSMALTAALFFSAETARIGVRLLSGARLREAVRSVDALAIGQSTGVALQALPWRRILVASRPNQDAMLALLR